MLFLTSFNLWSFSFFFCFTYIILFFSLIVYLLPISLTSSNLLNSFQNKSHFYFVSGLECIFFLTTPLMSIVFINLIFSYSDISAWFGHLVFCGFQSKMVYLISLIFIIITVMLLSTSYFSSNEIYDFLIAQLNTFYWIVLIFLSNSLFTIIFSIEVLSTLVFLLITTSVFSTSFFYKNISFDTKLFFQNSTPYSFLQSLLFFFWISLISSLNLFVFLILFYNSMLTLDWFLAEHIFIYVINVSSLKELLTIGVTWFIILFSIFLKCGIVPLFIWKPTFFKGLNFPILIFYITFFYYFLFLFFINFLTLYFNYIFYYYTFITIFFILLGLFFLFFILCESFFLKIFFAISSILNSLLVFLALIATHNTDFFFYL